jgi:hypothetical protein
MVAGIQIAGIQVAGTQLVFVAYTIIVSFFRVNDLYQSSLGQVQRKQNVPVYGEQIPLLTRNGNAGISSLSCNKRCGKRRSILREICPRMLLHVQERRRLLTVAVAI